MRVGSTSCELLDASWRLVPTPTDIVTKSTSLPRHNVSSQTTFLQWRCAEFALDRGLVGGGRWGRSERNGRIRMRETTSLEVVPASRGVSRNLRQPLSFWSIFKLYPTWWGFFGPGHPTYEPWIDDVEIRRH